MGKAKRFHKRRKLGGIPFVGVFFSMTLALFILGIFGGLMLFAKEFTRKIRENVEIQVFLQRSVTESQIIAVRSTLSSMPFVAQKNGSAQITFVSKDDAAEAFSKEIGEDFVRYIGENPLSDLFIVRVAEDSQNPAQLRNIKAKIESLRSVLEVAYVEKLVESIYENITKLGILFVSLMVLLFIAVVVIMHHAIRLSLFSQRFLVRSMQLVGATAGFIKRPFLLRSVAYGFLASAAACFCLYALLSLAVARITHFGILYDQSKLHWLFAGIFFVGIFTSYFSTRYAITRYLRMSLDDLY